MAVFIIVWNIPRGSLIVVDRVHHHGSLIESLDNHRFLLFFPFSFTLFGFCTQIQYQVLRAKLIKFPLSSTKNTSQYSEQLPKYPFLRTTPYNLILQNQIRKYKTRLYAEFGYDWDGVQAKISIVVKRDIFWRLPPWWMWTVWIRIFASICGSIVCRHCLGPWIYHEIEPSPGSNRHELTEKFASIFLSLFWWCWFWGRGATAAGSAGTEAQNEKYQERRYHPHTSDKSNEW